jgi:deoxyribose-phosphate aldolase
MIETGFQHYFDHTLLKPEAKEEDIIKLCQEASQYEFYSVCVNSRFVPLAVSLLAGTPVKVACVVGFPLGAMSTQAKAYETDWACSHGASEIDMVLPIGPLLDGKTEEVEQDILVVCQFAHEQNALVKVILEIDLLTEKEIVLACQLAKKAGADYVKTSTGFSKGGATVEAVSLMRKTVGTDMGVKASGGIRDLSTAKKMLEAGASRLGASASVAIMEEFLSKGEK